MVPSIVQYWHDRELPAEAAALTASFAERNPGLRHRIFCKQEAEEFIGGHLCAREVRAFRACGPPAMQADYFRYCAGFVLGGISSDVDMRCRRPLAPLLETEAEGVLFRWSSNQIVSGLFAFKRAEDPLLRLVIDVATANIERRRPNDVWAVTGGRILNTLDMLYRLGSAEAVREKLRGSRVSPDSLLELAGGHAAVASLFERLNVLTFEATREWIDTVSGPDWKRGEDDWRAWQRRGDSIFRPA